MNYCADENGMNQPLTIQSKQVTSNEPYDQTIPSDINPTITTPGLTFSSTDVLINITLIQPATLTLIYIPTNRPNQPTNVEEFQLTFVYPNGSQSDLYISKIPSTSGTTTTPTTNGIVLPSDASPQVDLSPNLHVPSGTVVMITITSTKGFASPSGVSEYLLSLETFETRSHISSIH